MRGDWVILHAGALGDLVLTIQLALRLPAVNECGRLHLISRTDPGDLSDCQPSITRQSADALGLHWLYSADAVPAPAALRDAIGGARVLNALGDVESVVHCRLVTLRPAGLYSFDPRPRTALRGHITHQWQTDLEAQGLLIPKCIHQHPDHRSLGVPEAIRARGRQALRDVGCGADGLLIHPGSGSRAKCWPLPNFLDVARRMRERDIAVCFLIGPVELEWWGQAGLAAVEREFAVLRLPTPDVLAAASAGAKAFVGNDSGPTHLAALLGTHTVAVFGPTSPARWRPLGRDVTTIVGGPERRSGDWGVRAESVVDSICKSLSLKR